MKKIFLIIALFAAFGISAQLTYAQSVLRLGQRVEKRATEAAARQDASLTALKTRADNMIAARLNSLQQLLTRVQNDKHLSESDKTSLTSDITTAVSNLNTLKTKIDADTDLATLRSDAKSIVTSYRIYEIFEPKIRLLIIINNLLAENAKLSSLSGQIQTLLNQLKSQGKDVSGAQTALNDMNTQITAISALLATDKTLVSNITIQTSNPQSIFSQVRKDYATIRADFAKIRNDIAIIRSVFQGMLKPLTTPTGATESAK